MRRTEEKDEKDGGQGEEEFVAAEEMEDEGPNINKLPINRQSGQML